jgi:hypothetical protein
MILPSYDPNVLPAIREMYSKDPTVFGVDPLHLQGMLKDEGYLDYWPTLADIGAALDVLAIERGRGDAIDLRWNVLANVTSFTSWGQTDLTFANLNDPYSSLS